MRGSAAWMRSWKCSLAGMRAGVLFVMWSCAEAATHHRIISVAICRLTVRCGVQQWTRRAPKKLQRKLAWLPMLHGMHSRLSTKSETNRLR